MYMSMVLVISRHFDSLFSIPDWPVDNSWALQGVSKFDKSLCLCVKEFHILSMFIWRKIVFKSRKGLWKWNHTQTHNLRISGKKLKIYYIVQILSTYMTHKSDYIMGIVVHVNYVAHVPSSVILLMYGNNFSGNGWL